MDGERKILGRNDHQLTSAAGYAGGTSTGDEGRVCYHNFQRLADYGKLGHAEVVRMDIPHSKIGDFADLYFSLFDPKTKGRCAPAWLGRMLAWRWLCCDLARAQLYLSINL